MRRVNHPETLQIASDAARLGLSRCVSQSGPALSGYLRALTALALFLLLFVPSAAATAVRNCDIARDPLACRLDSILNVLYGAAFVLAVVLLGVVWAAVRMYRRNRTVPPVIEDDE